MAEEVDQVYKLYYQALNGDIPDLVISGTCGMMYNGVYSRSHPKLQEALEKTKNGRIQEIVSKIPNVNREDAELSSRGLTLFSILDCAKKGNDQIQYFLPIVTEMHVEIKGLLDNQASRDLSFGSSIYKDWGNFYKQMKDALLTPLTPSEKNRSKIASDDAQKRFKDLINEAGAAGVSQNSIYKAFIPISKKINTSWGSFNQLVDFREQEFNRLVLEAAGGDSTKKQDVINNAEKVQKIRNFIDAATVYRVCISDLPQSEEIRVPAEEALKTLIDEAKIICKTQQRPEEDVERTRDLEPV